MMRPSLIQSGGGGGVDPALEGRVNAVLQQRTLGGGAAFFGSKVLDWEAPASTLGLSDGFVLDLAFQSDVDDPNTHGSYSFEYTDAQYGSDTIGGLLTAVAAWATSTFTGIDCYASYGLGAPATFSFFVALGAPEGQRMVAVFDSPLAQALGITVFDEARFGLEQREGLTADDVTVGATALPTAFDNLNRLAWTALRAATAIASGTPVRERVIRYDELTSSGVWSKEAVLELPEFAGLTADDVEMEVICVSGGGGGRSGTNAPGGYPGRVAWRHFRMSDLPATLPMTVGSGGVSNSGGGSTFFGATTADDALVLCYGPSSYGPGGSATLAEGAIAGLNFSMVKAPDLSTYTSSSSRPNSADGPAAGGFASSGLTDPGRGSMVLGIDGSWPPATVNDRSDGKPGVPRSFGAGGRGNTSGTGGAGGHPGGGGGGGSTAGGPGGNGAIRIIYRVKEIR